MKERDKYFDVLKGYAIFLVAFCHCVQAFVPDWSATPVGRGIVMFHMPLFMCVSGYFFHPPVKEQSCWLFLRKKFEHLYLPSLCWGAFSVVLLGGNKWVQHKPMEWGYLCGVLFTGMWFLTVLFMLSVLGALIHRQAHGARAACLWAVAFALLHFTPPTKYFVCLNELKFMLPFFVMGIYSKRFSWRGCRWWLFSLSALVFAYLLLRVYTFDFSVYSMGRDVLSLDYQVKALVRLLAGVSGIVCSAWLCKWLLRCGPLSTWLSGLGTLTLPIYVLHQKFLMPVGLLHLQSGNLLLSLVASLVVMLLSVWVYRLLRHRYVRLLFFGESLPVH